MPTTSFTRRVRAGSPRPAPTWSPPRTLESGAAEVVEAQPACAPQRMAFNFAALSLAEVACRALSMIVTLSLAQRLGRAGYGRVEFAFNLVFWLVLLVREGLDVIATREIARHPRLIRPLVNHILAIRVCLAGLLLTGLYAFSWLTFAEAADRRLLMLYGGMLLTTAMGVDFVFRGLERMGLVAISLILRTAVYAVGASLWVAGPSMVIWVPFWLVAGELFGIGLVWAIYIKQYGLPRPTLRATRSLRTIIRRGRPVYLNQVSQAIIGSADLLVVGLMSQWADVGLYGAPHRMIVAILTFGIIFRQVVFPSLARSWRANPDEGRAGLDTMVRVLMLGFIPVAVGATVLARPLVEFLLSPEYRDSASLLAIGAWRIPILSVAFLYQSALIALNREQSGLRMIVLAAVLAGPLAAVMRHYFGLEGASASMLVVGLGLLLAGHLRLRLDDRAPAWHHHVAKPLVGSAMMVPVCLLLAQWSVVLAIAGGAAVYVGMIVFLNGIQPDELKAIVRQ